MTCKAGASIPPGSQNYPRENIHQNSINFTNLHMTSDVRILTVMFACMTNFSPFVPMNRHATSSTDAEMIWNLSCFFVNVFSRNFISSLSLVRQAILSPGQHRKAEMCDGITNFLSIPETKHKLCPIWRGSTRARALALP